MEGFTNIGTLTDTCYSFDRSDVPSLPGLYIFQLQHGPVWNVGEGGAQGWGLRTLLRYGPWLSKGYPSGSTAALRKKYDNERRKQGEWRRLIGGNPLLIWIRTASSDTATRRGEEAQLTNELQPIWNLYRKGFGRKDPTSKAVSEALERAVRLVNSQVR